MNANVFFIQLYMQLECTKKCIDQEIRPRGERENR